MDLRAAEKSDRQWSRVSERRCRTQVHFTKATKAERPIPSQQSEVSAIIGWHERLDRRHLLSSPGRRVMPSLASSKTYGTVSPEQQNEMTGLEFVRGMADGTLPLNTIAKTLGYEIAEAESGRVVVTAEPRDIHLNPAGTVHGGLAATMLDSCMGLAIQSTLEKGIDSTTLEFKISFVRPITPEIGLIKAEGTVISRGRRVGTAEGRVTDSRGRLLVHGTCTCLIFER